MVLQVESKVLYILGRCPATELSPYPGAVSQDAWSCQCELERVLLPALFMLCAEPLPSSAAAILLLLGCWERRPLPWSLTSAAVS